MSSKTGSGPAPEKTGGESAVSGESTKSKSHRPTRNLPTNRVALSKQFDLLRAFGAASGPDGNPTTNVDVSKIVGLHQATVGLAVPFFVDVGFLAKVSDGVVPAQEIQDYTASYEWNPETAFQRVAPILRESWFFTRILPKLRYGRLTRKDAITELSMAASAGPTFKGQLDTLIDYLTEAGLVVDDGGQLRLGQPGEDQAASNGNGYGADIAPRNAPNEPDTGSRAQPMVTSFASPTAGVVKFNISVNVDMTEFAGWSPERITAFFSGVAQVLAAKGKMEEKIVSID
jgi:hypothetical protein